MFPTRALARFLWWKMSSGKLLELRRTSMNPWHLDQLNRCAKYNHHILIQIFGYLLMFSILFVIEACDGRRDLCHPIGIQFNT